MCVVFAFLIITTVPFAKAFDFSDAISGQYWNQFVNSIALKPGATNSEQLIIYRDKINAWDWAHAYWGSNTGEVVIAPDKANNCMRLQDSSDGRWIVLPDGTYPFVPVGGDVPDEGANTPLPPSTSRNNFVNVRSLRSPYVVISYTALSEAAVKINEDGTPCTIQKLNNTQYGISRTSTPEYFYANSKNQPFVAVDDRSVTNVDFDYIYNNNTVDNSEHLTVDDFKILDINNNTMNLVNDKGQTTNYNIESLYYDASSKSYTANVYNTVYNTTNNYYEYNYYTYNISYNITNTYVTYIGSTAEYTDPYEYYFELPDGRSSADMTPEEVEGISLAFDVCNYDRVATDTHTRSLYHFDGDWKDSSYYSDRTSLSWQSGASITYLDSNAFDGCLYLDSSAHQFTATFPSLPRSSDCTAQFRMYFGGGTMESFRTRSGKGDASFEPSGAYNYFGYSGNPILAWDSKYIYLAATGRNSSGTSYTFFYRVCPVPVGSWADICLVRTGVYTYVFINGVRYGFVDGDVFTITGMPVFTLTPRSLSGVNNVRLSFSANVHSFTYLDELRVVDFAVYTANFQPSPVPYDTNNIFVLPDSKSLKDLTIAVQSDIPVFGYRVGGVRPTFPDRGMVYLPVENGRAIDCQIYNGTYWESVECRLWTGSRWIPMWAFDILTLSDCWDVADGTGSPPITTEQGFWSWWQKEWLDFRAWLTTLFGDGSGGGGGSTGGDGGGLDGIKDALLGGLTALIETLFAVVAPVLSALLSLVTDLLSFIFGFLSESVVSSIGSFFASFTDGSIFEFFQPGAEGEGAALPNDVVTVFSFFSGVILLLPAELRSLLFFAIAAMVLISVFKLVKS